MKVLKTTYHENMASGNNYCAHVQLDSRQTTAFGKTEEEAVSNAKLKIQNLKK